MRAAKAVITDGCRLGSGVFGSADFSPQAVTIQVGSPRQGPLLCPTGDLSITEQEDPPLEFSNQLRLGPVLVALALHFFAYHWQEGEPPTPLELRSADFSPQATEASEPQMDVDAAAVFQSRQWVPLKPTGLGGQSAEGSVEMARR